MTKQDHAGQTGEEKERDAIGGFLSPARHVPDDEPGPQPLGGAHGGTRESSDQPGSADDVNTARQAGVEGRGDATGPAEQGTAEMTAAEVSGQVPFGAKDTEGETGGTGAESSSG